MNRYWQLLEQAEAAQEKEEHSHLTQHGLEDVQAPLHERWNHMLQALEQEEAQRLK